MRRGRRPRPAAGRTRRSGGSRARPIYGAVAGSARPPPARAPGRRAGRPEPDSPDGGQHRRQHTQRCGAVAQQCVDHAAGRDQQRPRRVDVARVSECAPREPRAPPSTNEATCCCPRSRRAPRQSRSCPRRPPPQLRTAARAFVRAGSRLEGAIRAKGGPLGPASVRIGVPALRGRQAGAARVPASTLRGDVFPPPGSGRPSLLAPSVWPACSGSRAPARRRMPW